MVKKLIISACLVLVMAVMAPAQPNVKPFLNLDINGGNGPTQQNYPSGWEDWWGLDHPAYSSKYGTLTKTMGAYTVTITSVNYSGGTNGDARDRGAPSGGDDQYLSNVYRDFVYTPRTAPGFGADWLEVTISGLVTDKDYEITVFNFDNNHGWEGQDARDCNDKFMAWGVDNPGDYTTNGYQPGADPCAPYEVMVPCAGYLPGPGGPNEVNDPWWYSGSFEATAGRGGSLTIYGWFNPGQWSGTQHALINGIAIGVPEPATVALLGLGGLALVRRRKR